MNAKAFFIALGVGIGLVLGEGVKPQKPARAKPKVIDLDFTDDESWPSDGEDARDPAPPKRQWMYWTAGVSVLAAGGVGWYLFRDQGKDPAVTRNEQIFTDERP